MKGFFRLFNIYSGEEKNTFLFASLGFIWSLGVTAGWKFADALFLLHVGAASLPLAYGTTACIMMLLTVFLLKAFHRVSIERIFTSVLLVGVLFYLLAYICLQTNLGTESKWLWFALKVFGSLFFSLIVTCFWSFIDQYYHLQDAKRLYSVFTSTVFLGLATTGLIMRSGLIDFKYIVLGIVALLLLSCAWIRLIQKNVKPVFDESASEMSSEQTRKTYRFLFQSILKSPFTLLLMTGNLLAYLFLVITEYNYLTAFDALFDPTGISFAGHEEKAQLTLFLGQCIAVVSVINLIVGLFLYSRFVRRFGISNLILWTPSFLVITFSGWIFSDALIFPLMGFFVVEGMLYMIDDNNFNLLLNAVPGKLKYKIRLIIESFFEPTGMLISSLLITFVPVDSKKIGLVLSVCALIVALLFRKQYLKAIYIALSENAIHFQRSLRDWFKRKPGKASDSAEHQLFSILQNEDETAKLLALEALLTFKNFTFLQKLLLQTDSLSDKGKEAFLILLAKSPLSMHPQVIDHLQKWLENTDDTHLSSTLQFYLASNGELPYYISKPSASPEIRLKGASILALYPEDPVKAQLEITSLINSHSLEEKCMGATLLGFLKSAPAETLLHLLKNDETELARCAANAIAQLATPHSTQFVPALIAQLGSLSDTEIRQYCLKALGKINNPDLTPAIIKNSIHFRPNERRLAESILVQILPVPTGHLLEITQDIKMHDQCRTLAGKILGRTDLNLLRNNIHQILNVEIDRAYFYYYYYHTVQDENPGIDLTSLRDALLSSYHSVLDFIIHLLGIVGEVEDVELLSKSIRSPNPKVRSHVLETLERTSEPVIYRSLYPLIAELPFEERIKNYTKNRKKKLNLTELLDTLADSPLPGNQIVAIALKYRLNMPHWREFLKQRMDSKEEILHHFAYELLE